jgi:glycerol-3-phosphate dehydrogenase
VLGGGVVGCAVARRLALAGLSVLLLERGPDILSGAASRGNSAILHTGFDAPEGSLELACVRRGYAEYLAVRERLGLPALRTGAHVVAWTDEQRARLPRIAERAHRNCVGDVEVIDATTLREREPRLAPGALAAVAVPGEYVVDPWSAPLAYALQAQANGAEFRFDCEVTGADRRGEGWALSTSRGTVQAGVVVNCAGLYGDVVDAMAGRQTFTIRPRKGQFVVLDKSAFPLVRSIILPVPTERTKGVLLAPTAFGNLLIGPTAEDVDERDTATVTEDTLRGLLDRGAAIVPEVREHAVTAAFAGLRPATEHRDYQVHVHGDGWVTVGGIRSTGLSGALGIAEHLWERMADEYALAPAPVAEPVWTPVPNIAEVVGRDYEVPGTDVVCHCEHVTRREVENALRGPMPARSLGALKRRTRVFMGRCQGFYCTGEVTALCEGRLPANLTAGAVQ